MIFDKENSFLFCKISNKTVPRRQYTSDNMSSLHSFTFRFQRHALIALNIIYMVIGLILIILPAYSKISSIFTSWPMVGGVIACGVFIILVAILGIYGAVKHHQIILFFYMVILVFIFVILFSVSIAALSMSNHQLDVLLKNAWNNLSQKTKNEIQYNGDCCSFQNQTQDARTTCTDLKLRCCGQDYNHCENCQTCFKVLEKHGKQNIKNAVGGVAMFFSFTLFFGLFLAFRYRHLRDPRANPSAFL